MTQSRGFCDAQTEKSADGAGPDMFSLEQFEYLVHTPDHEASAGVLFFYCSRTASADAGAVTTLFFRPSCLFLPSDGIATLVFAVSGYGNGEHIICNISGSSVFHCC